MKVLVIGSGGREHALAWKLRQSPRVTEVIVAPGNAGTAGEAGVRNVPANVADVDELLAVAKREGVGLTIVGPEVPLVAGVVDRFRDAGLRIFGGGLQFAQIDSLNHGRQLQQNVAAQVAACGERADEKLHAGECAAHLTLLESAWPIDARMTAGMLA